MLQIVNTINSYLSDYILVFLLVAVGLWYTVKTKCVQRYLWKGLKQLFGGFAQVQVISKKGIKGFQVLGIIELVVFRQSGHSRGNHLFQVAAVGIGGQHAQCSHVFILYQPVVKHAAELQGICCFLNLLGKLEQFICDAADTCVEGKRAICF